jgi:nucleotide-binding universal stress UspA family protein
VPEPGSSAPRRPTILCYDGSDFARRAIEQAAAVLGGGPAVVVTIFESVGSALLRHTPFAETELGRQFKEISEDVVNELDADAARQAHATAGEGAEVAGAAGFDAEPLAQRALSKTAERNTSTVWRAILAIADEQEAVVIVVGARGTSGIGSALLGSVSHGLLHNSTRPLLVVPPAR